MILFLVISPDPVFNESCHLWYVLAFCSCVDTLIQVTTSSYTSIEK